MLWSEVLKPQDDVYPLHRPHPPQSDVRLRRYTRALSIRDRCDAAFARVKRLVADTRRTRVLTVTDRYLHARCRTRIGFVDDLELLLCRRQGVIQVRSASRFGIYDFGVNRRRVERLRRRFEGA